MKNFGSEIMSSESINNVVNVSISTDLTNLRSLYSPHKIRKPRNLDAWLANIKNSKVPSLRKIARSYERWERAIAKPENVARIRQANPTHSHHSGSPPTDPHQQEPEEDFSLPKPVKKRLTKKLIPFVRRLRNPRNFYTTRKNTAYKPRSRKKRSQHALSFRKIPFISTLLPRTPKNVFDSKVAFGVTDPLEVFKAFVNRFVFIDEMRLRDFPPTLCQHFYVLSSLVRNLLKNQPILSDLHQYYFTGRSRYLGRLAEEFVEGSLFDLQRVACKKSTRFPFIVSTPDFVRAEMRNGKQVRIVVEVKSSKNIEELRFIARKKNTQVNFQVLCTMSIFNCQEGEVVLVHYRENASPEHRIVEIVKYFAQVSFFDEWGILLGEKYFDNVLRPYFATEMNIAWTKMQETQARHYFLRELQKTQKKKELSGCTRTEEQVYSTTGHRKASCILKYKK